MIPSSATTATVAISGSRGLARSNQSSRSPINYPWSFAALSLVALFISRTFEKPPETAAAPPEPPGFVGPLEPEIADRLVLRTTVTCSGHATQIGNAFAAIPSPDVPPVILTALHRLGPAGGLAQLITPETIATKIEKIEFTGAHTGTPLEGVNATPLSIPTSATLENVSAAGDVVAFVPDKDGASQLQALPLSSDLPIAGSAIWIALAREPVQDGEEPPRALRALVTDADPSSGTFYYQFPPGTLTLAQANQQTGAPIIDLAGNIIGIHVGAAKNPGEETPFGLAHSAGRFIPHLASALGVNPNAEAMASTKAKEPK